MKYRMIRYIYILIIAAIFNPSGLAAQAIKVNYGAYSTFKTPDERGEIPIYFGLGYEQNIGERISVSLEYNFHASWFDKKDDIFMSEKYLDQYNFNYIQGVQFPLKELSYTSRYFFSDNDERSYYISSGLAMQFVKYRWQLENASFYSVNGAYNNPPDFSLGTFEEQITILPLTLKIGHRGSLDGDFGDYSIGLRYNIGNNKLPKDKTYIFIDHPGTKNISFIFSASWGIGWAD